MNQPVSTPRPRCRTIDPPCQADLADASHDHVAASADLLRRSSIELTTNGRETIARAAGVLPAGMNVYVPKLPRQTLSDKLVQIAYLREFGLEPIPHIAARQLGSAEELRSFVARAAGESGVRRVLVIGGDQTEAAGPFRDSAEVIGSGILSAAGIREIDVAGYPERHPRIPRQTLLDDIDVKIRMAREQGLALNVVTQFSFSPPNIIEYCGLLATRAPSVPVFAGMAGPTSAARLLRYAKICGVATSLRAANSLGLNAVKLALHTSPDRQFEAMAAHRADHGATSLAGIHLFSFGGFVESAEWMSRLAYRVGL